MPPSMNLSSLASRAYSLQPRDPFAPGADRAARTRSASLRPLGAARADEDAVRVELSAAARQALSKRSGGTARHPAAPSQTSAAVATGIAAQVAGQQSGPSVQASGAGRREAPLVAARTAQARNIPPGSHVDIRV